MPNIKDLERCVLTNRCASETDPESDTDSLPDRLINLGEYEPLQQHPPFLSPLIQKTKNQTITNQELQHSERKLLVIVTYHFLDIRCVADAVDKPLFTCCTT